MGAESTYNCGKELKQKLQKCQFRAARIITGESFDKRTVDTLEILIYEVLETRREYLKNIIRTKSKWIVFENE